MQLATDLRIKWPVPAVRMLDVATLAAGGDPTTVHRDEEHPSPIWNMSWVRNQPNQGMNALLWVRWCEQPDHGDGETPAPPALVVLTALTPYEHPHLPMTGYEVLAETILPPVRDWLDQQRVPHTAWWWRVEYLDTYHPGTVDVAGLTDLETPRETWTPPDSSPASNNPAS